MHLVSFKKLPQYDSEEEEEKEEEEPKGEESDATGVETGRFGAVLAEIGMIVDLTAALPKKWQPLNAKTFLQKGEDAFRRASEAISRGQHRIPLDHVKLLAPICDPGVVINVVENFGEHSDPTAALNELEQEAEALRLIQEEQARLNTAGSEITSHSGGSPPHSAGGANTAAPFRNRGRRKGLMDPSAQSGEGKHDKTTPGQVGDPPSTDAPLNASDAPGRVSRRQRANGPAEGWNSPTGNNVPPPPTDTGMTSPPVSPNRGTISPHRFQGGSSPPRSPDSKREVKVGFGDQFLRSSLGSREGPREPRANGQDGEPPEARVPIFYTKFVSGVYGHNSYVPMKEGAPAQVSCQLALVIGQECRRINENEAADFIAGLCVCCDFAVPDWVTNESKWLIGSAYDAPLLIGPAILQWSEVQDLEGIKIRLSINKKLIVEGKLCDMIDSPGKLLAHISKFITLQPGDIVCCGAPLPLRGVETPALQPGDIVVCRADQIGEVSCTIVEDTLID